MTRSTGTTTWLDLGTTDLAAAKTFYEQLFGWDFEDTGEEMGHYHMIRKDGALVAGAMSVAGMTCPEGDPLPSEWGVYLAVDDLDARLALAEKHGATVVVPAGDVGAGRFGVVLDPSHAVIGLWQAGGLDGYDFSGDPGTPVWFELMTQDFDKAVAFYTDVFDFRPTPLTTEMDDPQSRYVTNAPGQEASSGICDVAGFFPADVGSFWRVYFCVEDCDATVDRVKELGGALLDGPIDSPFGRIATLADPTGASFQISAVSQAVPEGGAS